MSRINIVKLSIILLFLVLFLGAFYLQLISWHKYKELSDRNCIRLLPQQGSRGMIIDTNGNIIAASKPSYDVMLIPQGLKQKEEVLQILSKILNISVAKLSSTYDKEFISTSMPVTIARGIDLKKAIIIGELKSDVPSVVVQLNPVRYYPHKNLAAHVLGYISEIDRWRLTKLEDYGYNKRDLVGFGGVEEKYDYYLRQEEGGLSVEVDHKGRFIRTLGFNPARHGKDIQLTLDLKIQQIAEDSLAQRKGAVVIINPYTGAILAMASGPSFYPSIFVDKDQDAISKVFSDSDSPLIDRSLSAGYPAGSIFKVIVATAALETKKINANTSFVCTGEVSVGGKRFRCWDVHGQQDLNAAIANSCNSFFYRTGLLTGAQNIYDYALKFGFSHPIPFELPSEEQGFIPSPMWRKINKFKNWYDGDTANLSIGQGDVSITPLQAVRMIAVFANGGYLVYPYIVKNISGYDVSAHQRKYISLNLRKSTLDYIRRGLRGVVLTGTGNVLSGLSVEVAGKTGTAQAPPGEAHAWFVGYFPFKQPKFAICVLLEHGGPGYYACLIAKDIIDKMSKEGLI